VVELIDLAAPIIRDLGIIGVLLIWLAVSSKRYDKVVKSAEEQISKVNEKRVEEARENAKSVDSHLELLSQMMQHVAVSIQALQSVSKTLDGVTHRLARTAEDIDRADRNRPNG